MYKRQILTNSLQVSLKAIPYENLNVISLPGFLKRETLSFVDGNIAEYLKAYNITKAFMSCTGISIQNGLSNASSEEYLVKKSVLENSTIRFALADHSKFGDFSLMTFCPFKDIDHILTDQLPSEEFCDFAKMHSINIETCLLSTSYSFSIFSPFLIILYNRCGGRYPCSKPS